MPRGRHAERQARYRARQLAQQKLPPAHGSAQPRAALVRYRRRTAHLAGRVCRLVRRSTRQRDSATAEALQAIVDLDLNDLAAIVPPRGFGRD